MAGLSMPSGRSGGTSSDPRAKLALMQNALAGGAASSAAPMNMLAGAAPVAPASGANLLAAGVTSPPPPPPAVSAAPVAVAVQPEPAVPTGQERHAAVGGVIAADKMSDADLRGQSDRYEWVRGALGQALQQPDLSHADVVQLVADGVRSKIIPSAEASKILGDLPTDPTSLRDALEQRQVIAGHGLVHMTMEQQRRDSAE